MAATHDMHQLPNHGFMCVTNKHQFATHGMSRIRMSVSASMPHLRWFWENISTDTVFPAAMTLC